MGSIVHKGGLTWAGSHDVWMSPDSGLTWQNRTVGSLGADYIDDINFFDRSTGIVCTHNGSVFITTDQGLSWRMVQRPGSANSGAFMGNANSIVVATGAGGTVDVSLDGGFTWTSTTIGTFVTSVRPLLGGGALALGGGQAAGRSIFKTTNYGATWQQQSGTIESDSWSLDVDPCEPLNVYAVNEESLPDPRFNDTRASIYHSVDGGASWQIVASQPNRVYYCGSVVIAAPAVFAQTSANGILRSTDQGTTWISIGGPSAAFDSRLVCPITANIILAADNTGTIWRTFSSGGDSLVGVKPLAGLDIQPEQLFVNDTLLNCDSPVVRTVTLKLQLCSYPKISKQYITGADSDDYAIVQGIRDSLSALDSAKISFHPRSSGAQHGEYVIVLEDGTQIAIPLAGTGRGIVFVEPTSASVVVDTIGGDASVPIEIKGLPKKEVIELVAHYDPKLIYSGAFASNGTQLDMPGEQWAGRSKLHIDTAALRIDSASGALRFTVFPDGDTCFSVTLDSMSILNPLAPCTYSVGSGKPKTVCPPIGCGIMTITRFLRYHRPPEFRVFPNPTSGTVELESDTELPEAVMTLSDAAGIPVITRPISLHRGNNSLEFGSIAPGWYILHLRSTAVDASTVVLVTR